MRSETVRLGVVEKLVELVESGEFGSWEMPWHRLPAALPHNVKSQRRYRNGNALHLWLSMMLNGWSSGVFGTYNQWKALVAQVRRGERGTGILIPVTKTDEDTGIEQVAGFRGIAVFAAEQVDGWAIPEPETPANPKDRIRSADDWTDRVIAAAGMDFAEDGDRAFYRPGDDVVRIPPFARFKTADGFYATVWHEFTHWTGHESRLNRFENQAGADGYAFEELVAELGAAFLTAEHGWRSEAREDHAAYVAGWLEALKAEPELLWKAATHATKAVDYLHGLAGTT